MLIQLNDREVKILDAALCFLSCNLDNELFQQLQGLDDDADVSDTDINAVTAEIHALAARISCPLEDQEFVLSREPTAILRQASDGKHEVWAKIHGDTSDVIGFGDSPEAAWERAKAYIGKEPPAASR